MLKRFLLSFVSLLLVVSAFGWDYPLAKPQIDSNSGRPAPLFTLKDHEGKAVSLESMRGSKVMLVFYRAYWCPYCMNQLKDIAKNIDRFRTAGVKVFAISADEGEHVKKVYEKAAMKQFPVLSDPGAKTIREYGILQQAQKQDEHDIAIRTTLLIDEKGNEVWRRVSKTAADIPKAEELLQRIEQK